METASHADVSLVLALAGYGLHSAQAFIRVVGSRCGDQKLRTVFKTSVRTVSHKSNIQACSIVRFLTGPLNASMWTIKGIPGFGILSASKAAVRSFARTWANELRARRIRVNVVSPGLVHTPSIEKATGGRENAERLLSELTKDSPLGRAGNPDEIAKAVLFLASEDASYVNGAELFVDGGMAQI